MVHIRDSLKISLNLKENIVPLFAPFIGAVFTFTCVSRCPKTSGQQSIKVIVYPKCSEGSVKSGHRNHNGGYGPTESTIVF